MSGNSGGPWGGGGNRGSGNRGHLAAAATAARRRPWPGWQGPQIPEIEDLVKKGQQQLRVLMGGRGGGGGGGGSGARPFGARGPSGPGRPGGAVAVCLVLHGRPEERSVELLFGAGIQAGQSGAELCPLAGGDAEIVQVTTERVTEVGTGRGAGHRPDADPRRGGGGHRIPGRLERHQPGRFLFNLADPTKTVRAVSESAMRDIIARSELSPILNRDRGAIAADLRGRAGNARQL
jgi:modulator of FtsH protease HflK